KNNNIKTILILGGSAVGVELASELLDTFGNTKNLIIIEGSNSLVPFFPLKSQQYIIQHFKKFKNVKILLNSYIKNIEKNNVKLTDNTIIKGDYIYNCLGYFPNSNIISNSDIEFNKYL